MFTLNSRYRVPKMIARLYDIPAQTVCTQFRMTTTTTLTTAPKPSSSNTVKAVDDDDAGQGDCEKDNLP